MNPVRPLTTQQKLIAQGFLSYQTNVVLQRFIPLEIPRDLYSAVVASKKFLTGFTGGLTG